MNDTPPHTYGMRNATVIKYHELADALHGDWNRLPGNSRLERSVCCHNTVTIVSRVLAGDSGAVVEYHRTVAVASWGRWQMRDFSKCIAGDGILAERGMCYLESNVGSESARALVVTDGRHGGSSRCRCKCWQCKHRRECCTCGEKQD